MGRVELFHFLMGCSGDLIPFLWAPEAKLVRVSEVYTSLSATEGICFKRVLKGHAAAAQVGENTPPRPVSHSDTCSAFNFKDAIAIFSFDIKRPAIASMF